MFSQPSKALQSMALGYGVRLLYHKGQAFAERGGEKHSFQRLYSGTVDQGHPALVADIKRRVAPGRQEGDLP